MNAHRVLLELHQSLSQQLNNQESLPVELPADREQIRLKFHREGEIPKTPPGRGVVPQVKWVLESMTASLPAEQITEVLRQIRQEGPYDTDGLIRLLKPSKETTGQLLTMLMLSPYASRLVIDLTMLDDGSLSSVITIQ